MAYKFALVGNPNCGKTTMFNEITGSTQYVGNWPGVTVEKKEGRAKKFNVDVRIIDLPGIYSLSPYSMEEIIARDYIIDEKPDVIINIVDATNIERNLYLTTQVLEFGVPTVVALNMMDVVESRGDKINIDTLERQLGVPVIPTSASKGTGVREVVEKALYVSKAAASSSGYVYKDKDYKIYDKYIEDSLDEVEAIVSDTAGKRGYKSRWVALKVLEGDEKVIEKLNISNYLIKKINVFQNELEKKYDNDVESIIADNRYRYISEVVDRSVKKSNKAGQLTISDKIDKVVTNRVFAIPIFLLIMYGIFKLTFDVIGGPLTEGIEGFVDGPGAEALSRWLEAAGASNWLQSLVVDGIFAGLGSVLTFVPQIMVLFLFLSILEDSGYMARAAFVMDKLFRKFGLTGKSFIPMLMGFGCSVPGVMATRTMENEKDRKLTMILTPFMSCGAKLPVYALFAGAFFEEKQSLVVFSLYVLGIVVAIVSGIILKNTVFKGESSPFVMELPPYRIPTLKGLLIHMWDRVKSFLKKAGTIIFSATVVIWFCQSFSFSMQMVEDPADSMFGVIGKAISPIFAPLGFGDWKSSVALLTGLVAKEAVVATMGILNGIGSATEESLELITTIQTYFTPLRAYSFMAFTLLYMPCIAAFAAIKREMNSWKWAIFAVLYQTGVAWIVSFLIFQGGRLFGLS